MRRFPPRLLMVLLLPALVISCGRTGAPEPETRHAAANPITKEYREGPFCVRIMADRDSMSIAESLVLSIEAEVDEGFEAELPKFGEKLGEFGIRDYREDPPHMSAAGKIVSRKTYTLEPFLSGSYTISPLQVRFRKKPDAGGANGNGSSDEDQWEHHIETEEIAIKVNSLLPGDQKELALNPIKGPVGLPRGPFSAWYVIAGVCAAALIGGGIFHFVRRRKASIGKGAPVIPAHELAYRRLEEIIAENLIERGEIKLFFSKISDVLRSYIENRFGIHAPRRTTEEFLAGISRDAPFSDGHRGLLSVFLHDCDLVKFAEHCPPQAEIVRAMDSCKAFIDATKPEEAGEARGKG